MKRIELIGPSGVGKTTLYKKIKAIPEEDRLYLTLKEAYKYGAIYEDISIKDWPLWLYQKLLRVKVLDHKAQGLGKNILKGLQPDRRTKDDDSSFTISYSILLNYLRGKKSNYVRLVCIKNFTRKVEEYLMLERSLPNDVFVLFDEGMNHYHPGILTSESKYSAEELKKDIALNPAGIISCEQTPEVIYEQALARKKRGIITFTHGSLNNEELREHVKKNVSRHRKKVNSFKKIGIPVLHVDTHEKTAKIFKKIDRFIQTLSYDQQPNEFVKEW